MDLSNVKILPIVLIAIAASVGYGAGYIIKMLKVEDEEKQTKYKLVLKSISLVLAVAALLAAVYSG